MKVIIGLVAEKESGKTTTFNFIKAKLQDAVELMLAEHLKEVCAKVFKMEPIRFESQQEKKRLLEPAVTLTELQIVELGGLFELALPAEHVRKHIGKELKTTREILQYVGTDIMRAIDDDIHLKWAMRRAPLSNTYVVTDIRFPNEFEFFAKEPGFLPFSIDRKKDSLGDSSANHASETHIPELKKRCLGEIDNNGTVEQLKSQVDSLVVPHADRIKHA